jgi:formate dehydrogenase major subunit
MTNHWTDIKNSDCIIICGGNPAENHPASFRWVLAAKDRGAKVIVVDPRFNRSAAKADIFAQIRPGTDIAFFGGLVNYIIENELYHKEYVINYTNAPLLVDPNFSFKDGLFSGYSTKERKYDNTTWGYQRNADGSPKKDPTLKDPNCVFQILKKHYSRYDPDTVSKITGIPKDKFLEIAKTYAETGKPGKSGTLLYAMGLTQHTYGTQNIRAFVIVQLLLGNMGMPGGGINAERGESNVQGSTDLALLFHIIPGYLPTPSAEKHPTLKDYLADKKFTAGGYWVNGPKFFISLLKAFWGDAATPENDFAYHYMPKLGKGHKGGGYSHIALFEAMYDGVIKGLMCWGQNPVVSGPNVNMERKAMENLDWLLVADLWETETAAFWKAPGVDPKKIKTEVFLLPAASSIEKEGSVTNSGRVIQWRYKAIEPLSEAKSDLWMLDQLAKQLKKLYEEDEAAPNRGAILDLYWDYAEGDEEPDSEKLLFEMHGFNWKTKEPVKNFTQLMDDGSTACGNWIYSGVFDGYTNLAKRHDNRDPTGLGIYPKWTWCWPVNRRIIYNRCSSDPKGRPWSKEKAYIYWDGSAWVTNDVPDFKYKDAETGEMVPPEVSAANPFIMLPEGVGRHFAAGLKDGPIPEHYEPVESLFKNLLSPQQNNPVIKIWDSKMDSLAEIGSSDYPIIATTYRLVEHWQAGGMTRNLPWLCELQPEVFIEISEELADEKGIENGEWVKVASPRGEVEAVAMVTARIKPLSVDGKTVHVVGLPWHFGFKGECAGGPKYKHYGANQLTPHVGDANTMIPEYKAFVVDVRKVK